MSRGGDQDLNKFVNPNLSWKNVKKGSRSAKKPAQRNIEVGAELGNNISKNVGDSSVSESKRLGVPVLGKHFDEKIANVPIKKRKLFLPSPLPPPKTPSLNQEGSLSPHLNKCASGKPCSNSHDEKCANRNKNRLDIDGGVRSKRSEPTTEESCGGENLSGIALLAAVACSGSIGKDADHVESSGVEEHATTGTNDLLTAGVKETVAASESEGSSIPGNALPAVPSFHCGNENDSRGKCSDTLEKVKFDWDLNEMTDEWEELCFSLPQSSSGNCTNSIVDDGVQCQNLRMEDCRRNEFDNTGCDRGFVASDTEITSNKSDMINLFAPLASSTSNLAGQDDVIGDSRRQDVGHGFSGDTTANDGKLVTEEADQDGLQFQKSCKHLDNDKRASEDCDVCGSEVFQVEQKHPADGNSIIRVPEGYESPYEEGELRESPAHACDQKEVGEKENVCVDFEFDNSQTAQETSSLMKKNVDAVPGNDIIPRVEDVSSKPSSSLSMNLSGGYQSQEHCVNVKFDGKETDSKIYDEIKNGHDETMTSGENMSPNEGPLFFSDLDRSKTAYMKRSWSRDVGEMYFQTKREFASEEAMRRERLPFQGHSKNEVDYQWVDSEEEDREWRDRYANPRPRNGDYDRRTSRFNSHDRWQSRSYNPRGSYRPFNRRQSPTEQNNSYAFHREKQTMRGFSRERSKGRSRYSPEAFRRGHQGKYHERGSYYLERKERGFSPSFSRDSRSMLPHRRSRSRSRSLTPIIWNMHKRSTRQRSPESRLEGPVQGERLPFHMSGSSGDFEQGSPSPPRGHRMSPKHNSRCFEDRKSMDRQYRDRRSSPPGRMFRRNLRSDSVDHAERSKSTGEYFRSVRRLSPMPGYGQGPWNYDERSDARKNLEERYETMNRLRRYDNGAGVTEKFRYDDDDCIEFRNAREVDGCFSRRAAPSCIKDVRSSPVIHQEKLTNTDASSPGEQDFDGNASTKEAPSSLKEESSHVIHPGKLTNTDASSPGGQDFNGNASAKEASPSLREEESSPVTQQEKLTNTDASSHGEQDFDASASTKETPSSFKEESSHVIHPEKLTITDGSSPGEQDSNGTASAKEAPSSLKEEESTPVIQQEFTNIYASSPGEQDFNGNVSAEEAPSSIKEARSVPINHQEKLTNIDVSLPVEQDFDGNASTKEAPSSLKGECSPVIHQEKLTNTDGSSPGKQDCEGNASTKEESTPVIHQEKLTNTDGGEQDFEDNASTKEI